MFSQIETWFNSKPTYKGVEFRNYAFGSNKRPKSQFTLTETGFADLCGKADAFSESPYRGPYYKLVLIFTDYTSAELTAYMSSWLKVASLSQCFYVYSVGLGKQKMSPWFSLEPVANPGLVKRARLHSFATAYNCVISGHLVIHSDIVRLIVISCQEGTLVLDQTDAEFEANVETLQNEQAKFPHLQIEQVVFCPSVSARTVTETWKQIFRRLLSLVPVGKSFKLLSDNFNHYHVKYWKDCKLLFLYTMLNLDFMLQVPNLDDYVNLFSFPDKILTTSNVPALKNLIGFLNKRNQLKCINFVGESNASLGKKVVDLFGLNFLQSLTGVLITTTENPLVRNPASEELNPTNLIGGNSIALLFGPNMNLAKIGMFLNPYWVRTYHVFFQRARFTITKILAFFSQDICDQIVVRISCYTSKFRLLANNLSNFIEHRMLSLPLCNSKITFDFGTEVTNIRFVEERKLECKVLHLDEDKLEDIDFLALDAAFATEFPLEVLDDIF